MDDVVTPEPFDYRQLVNQQLIADAAQRYHALLERLATARSDETRAAQAIETTDQAFASATVSGDSEAAQAAADAHADAVTRAKLLSRGVHALELAVAESKMKALPAATAAAWLPVAEWARAERAAASAARDTAFAMLAAASARTHRANLALQAGRYVPAGFTGFAYRAGPGDPVLLAGLPLSAADEAATWVELGL